MFLWGNRHFSTLNGKEKTLDIKKIIASVPPKFSARVVSAILAFLITFAGFKCYKIISNTLSNSEKNGETGELITSDGESTDDTQASVTPEEGKEIIKTDNVLSITYGVCSESAVLYNIDKNEILCEKNMNYEVGVGDIATFITAIIIADKIEKGELSESDEVVCPASAAKRPNYALSSEIYSVGQRLNIKTLLTCMFYQRGSSFAYSLAVHTSGSEDSFVLEMNSFAENLGLKSTYFTNVCGQDDGLSKTTAYETAVVMKAFFEYDILKELFESDEPIIIKKNGAQSSVYLTVSNDFFETNCTENQASSDGIKGGKIGYCGYLNSGVILFDDGVYRYLSITLCGPSAFADAMQLYARLEAIDF